jgi:outer membrane immunogenic protein
MNRVRVTCVGVLALAGAVLNLAIGSANAADLPPRYAQPYKTPIYNPIFNWTGFYLGINGGGGWGQSQWDNVGTFSLSGGLIGGTIGYNWQFGQAVVGVEGDLDWSGIKGTTTAFCAPGCTTQNHWLSTVRGRVGYAFDRILPYLTAGLAVGDINSTLPGLPGGTADNAGWTVGAGVEFGVIANVTVKAEYLYVDLGNFNCGLNCGLLAGGNTSFTSNIFRGGLNVHF